LPSIKKQKMLWEEEEYKHPKPLRPQKKKKKRPLQEK